MPRKATIGLLAMLVLALPAGVEAKVLGTGTMVDERPTTVVLSETMIDPKYLVVDIITRPPSQVLAEWTLICSDGAGPVTGGEYRGQGSAHRRVKLPRKRGFCIVEVEAKLIGGEPAAPLKLRLRGRAEPPPIDL